MKFARTYAVTLAAIFAATLAIPALADDSNNNGVTRAQVKAELVQAEADGTVSRFSQTDYPPSDSDKAIARQLYQAAHPNTNTAVRVSSSN